MHRPRPSSAHPRRCGMLLAVPGHRPPPIHGGHPFHRRPYLGQSLPPPPPSALLLCVFLQLLTPPFCFDSEHQEDECYGEDWENGLLMKGSGSRTTGAAGTAAAEGFWPRPRSPTPAQPPPWRAISARRSTPSSTGSRIRYAAPPSATMLGLQLMHCSNNVFLHCSLTFANVVLQNFVLRSEEELACWGEDVPQFSLNSKTILFRAAGG